MGKNNTTGSPANFGNFIGTSKAMQTVYRKIRTLAPNNTPVFITGESGTGKELAAQSLHYYSDRRDKPFIAINCAALPNNLVESALFGHIKGAFTSADTERAGAIEQAENGTLFLDEICEMPLEIQAKLLRFTQDQTYQKLGCDKIKKSNIRIICATNRDIEEEIVLNKFREDLYYRLHVLSLEMPPLCERGQDIIDLSYHFLSKYKKENGAVIEDFSDSTLKLFCQYEWPGNVRELQNLIQQLAVSSIHPIIMETMLPDKILKHAFRKNKKPLEGYQHISLPLWKIEKQAIEKAIALCSGNIPQAAVILDIAPSTIYRKLQLWDKN